jgi:hypothetical protein
MSVIWETDVSTLADEGEWEDFWEDDEDFSSDEDSLNILDFGAEIQYTIDPPACECVDFSIRFPTFHDLIWSVVVRMQMGSDWRKLVAKTGSSEQVVRSILVDSYLCLAKRIAEEGSDVDVDAPWIRNLRFNSEIHMLCSSMFPQSAGELPARLAAPRGEFVRALHLAVWFSTATELWVLPNDWFVPRVIGDASFAIWLSSAVSSSIGRSDTELYYRYNHGIKFGSSFGDELMHAVDSCFSASRWATQFVVGELKWNRGNNGQPGFLEEAIGVSVTDCSVYDPSVIAGRVLPLHNLVCTLFGSSVNVHRLRVGGESAFGSLDLGHGNLVPSLLCCIGRGSLPPDFNRRFDGVYHIPFREYGKALLNFATK